MPITAVLALVAAAAMAGVPLLNGFLSKEMFFEESIAAGRSSGLQLGLPLLATLASVFSVAYSVRFIREVFFGRPNPDLPRMPHDPKLMLVPGALLVAACLLVGVVPAATVGPLLETAGTAILGDDLPTYELAVWHGFTLPLLMSFLALAGGLLYYYVMYVRERTMVSTPLLSRFDSKRMFDIVNVTLTRGAGSLARALFPNRLQIQLLLIVVSALVAGFWSLWSSDYGDGAATVSPVDPLFVLLTIGGAACAIGAAWQAKFHRLVALILLGGAGLVTSLAFAWFSAPDLALTQISVETVTIVLFLLGLRWLPRRLELAGQRRRTLRAQSRRIRDITIALAAGSCFALVTFLVLTRPGSSVLAPFFFANALDPAGGRNVVNIILVDFRGFDTLGEITVVGSVAIIVYSLLRRFRPAPESIAVPRAQRDSAGPARPHEPLPRDYTRIPAVLVRLLLPIAGLVSFHFLLRGHNAPGGGFVGGLVMATAIIAQYMVSGTVWVESRLRIHPQLLLALGLLAASLAGLGALVATKPFLSALSADLTLPLLGTIHLSTVLLFDLGVYMLVVGATVLMLIALAHQSLRSPRRIAATPIESDAELQAGEGARL
jgi:multicomponent K+:H+ antiporter subunit A